MTAEIERLKELIELGQAVAHEILKCSMYSGGVVTYYNIDKLRSQRLALFAEGNLERLREFTQRAAESGK